jgi:ABC-type uncharacterized transport system substrate-binding protein
LLDGNLINRLLIADAAKRYRLPTISENRMFADSGLLLGYGASIVAMFEYAASYVDKILKGAKAADLPVEQPTKFVLVINSKTAKLLGLNVQLSSSRLRSCINHVLYPRLKRADHLLLIAYEQANAASACSRNR